MGSWEPQAWSEEGAREAEGELPPLGWEARPCPGKVRTLEGSSYGGGMRCRRIRRCRLPVGSTLRS